MLRWMIFWLIGLSSGEAIADPEGVCVPLKLHADVLSKSNVPSEPYTIRVADGYIQKPATALPQPFKFCRCDTDMVLSIDVGRCAALFDSLQAKLDNRKISSIPIELNSPELLRMQIIAETQIAFGRRMLQLMSSQSEAEWLNQMQLEFELPQSAVDLVQRMRANLIRQGGAGSYVLQAGMSDYPYLVGIHAFEVRNGISENSPIDFNFWPHSTKGAYQNRDALAQLPHLNFEVQSNAASKDQSEDLNESMTRWIEALQPIAADWTRTQGDLIAIGFGLPDVNHELAEILGKMKIALVDLRNIVQAEDGRMFWREKIGGDLRPFNSAISLIDESELLSRFRRGPVPLLQQFVDNRRLGESIGKSLKPGIWYDYVYDHSAKVIGVKTDHDGVPQLFNGSIEAKIGDSIKLDFVSAIADRKLFLAGLGLSLFRNPLVTETMSRIGVLLACRKLRVSESDDCQAMAGLDRSNNTRWMQGEARIDLVETDGVRRRFDFAEILPESREAARKYFDAHVQKFNGEILVKARQHIQTALSVSDSGDGDRAVVSRAASIRFFVLSDAERSHQLLLSNTTAELAFVYGDEVGHGLPGAIVAPVLIPTTQNSSF
jgi:hypothetical protein